MPSINTYATGKVLLTGGYLILEPNYHGLVLPLSAKFYVSAEMIHKNDQIISFIEKNTHFLKKTDILILIKTPQIPTKFRLFTLNFENGSFLLKLALGEKIENDYIFECLKYSFKALNCYLPKKPDFEVLYGTRELPLFYRFCLFGDSHFYTEKGKTGLGSSAALTAAFTLNLIANFAKSKIFDLGWSDEQIRWASFRIALKAHNKAQGNVGSGFDVASAFFGGISFCKSLGQTSFSLGSPGFLEPIEVEEFTLPSCLDVMFGDVRKGSKTPDLVKRVLKWRRDYPKESALIWGNLSYFDKEIEQILKLLQNKTTSKETQTDISVSINNLKGLFAKNRVLYKAMGEMAGVGIEPDSQGEILDKTQAITGVVASFVPGAGGNDAVVALIENKEAVREKVKELWETEGIDTIDVSVFNDRPLMKQKI